ncbi:MAG: hypothetical protein ACLFST_14530 [Spirochaetia bacterium]
MMKSTGPLAVIGDYNMKRQDVIIHPNDGYDLGMMTDRYTVMLRDGGDAVKGEIFLKNECRTGTVIMNSALWEDIGKPKKLKLNYDDETVSFKKVD